MRKLILILASIILCWSASAQNIEKNEINEHGVRIIKAKQSLVIEDNLNLGVMLEYHESPQGIENYYITFLVPKGTKSTYIGKDQEIKFKTINDEPVVGLSTGTFRSNYVGGKWVLIGMYVVSSETIEKLSQKVSKIRVNYTVGDKVSFFDIETSDGNLAHYFKKAYSNIKKTIPLPVEKDRSEF